MEIVELQGHPFYVGAQFHPEFKSRPRRPSPLFLGLCLAAAGRLDNFLSGTALSPLKVSPPPPPRTPAAESCRGPATSQAC